MNYNITTPTFCIIQLDETPENVADVLEVYRLSEDFLALGPVATASESMVHADFALSRKGGGVFCGIYDPQTGKMTGVIDFIPADYKGDPGSAYLELLMIAAPYRGKGLGEQVVRVVEERIWQDPQIREIHAGVQNNNYGAIRFWQRVGYRITGEAEDCGDGTWGYPLLKTRAERQPAG